MPRIRPSWERVWVLRQEPASPRRVPSLEPRKLAPSQLSREVVRLVSEISSKLEIPLLQGGLRLLDEAFRRVELRSCFGVERADVDALQTGVRARDDVTNPALHVALCPGRRRLERRRLRHLVGD